jgi:protein-disulfide isomerase
VLDFPLESIHRSAFKAAEAAHCAGEQGKYWEMHDRLFANQRQLEPLIPHAQAIDLDVTAFETCLKSEKYAENIRQDMAEGRKGGTTGTPSFILATTDPQDPSKVKGIAFIRGAQPFNRFKTAIDQALATTGSNELKK